MMQLRNHHIVLIIPQLKVEFNLNKYIYLRLLSFLKYIILFISFAANNCQSLMIFFSTINNIENKYKLPLPKKI